MDVKTPDFISFANDTEMAQRMREYDWASSPLGPMTAWPPSLKVLVELMLASPLIATIACGPERLLLYNDAAARLYGNRHPLALGRPLAESFPESYPKVGFFYNRVFAGESVHVPAQPLDLHGSGRSHVFDAYLTPIRDEAGNVAYALMTGFDIGERLQAEAERDQEIRKRQESEDRLRLALEVAEVGTWTWNLQDNTGHLDARSAAILGLPAGPLAHVREAQRTTIHPDDRARVEEEIQVGITGREPFNLHYRVTHADGSVHFVASRAQVFTSETGVPLRLVGTNRDVTTERLAEIGLRETEERQAFLLKLSDALRPLSDLVAAQEIAARMLGTELHVDRCYYAEFDWPQDVLHIRREYVGSASFSVVGSHPISAFQDLLHHSHKGKPLVCDNIATHPLFSGEIAAYRERGTDGFILIPLVKQGIMVACMCVTMRIPRSWSAAEVELVREVADRTWDAVERARAEAALRQSEARFRTLFNSMNEGFAINKVIRDQRGHVVDAQYLELNPAFERQTGFQRDRAVERLASELFPNYYLPWLEIVECVIRTGKPERFEHFVPDNHKWFVFSINSLEEDDTFAVFYDDITARKLSEKRLRESEQRFRALVTAGTYSIYRMSPDWRFMYQLDSESLANTSGPMEDWADKYILDEDRPRVFAAVEQAIRTKSLFELEHRILLADGSIGWVLSRAVPLLDLEGEICEWFGAGSDVTERRAALEKLQESENNYRIELEQQVRDRTTELQKSRDLLQATMDSSLDMIQVFAAIRNEHGEIVDFRWLLNNHTSGSRYGEVRGESLLERNPGVVQEGIFDAFKRVTETGEPVLAERHYVHEQFNGWFLQSVVRLGDGVATTTKDITAWKEAQEEVLRLRDEIAQGKLQESEEQFRRALEEAPIPVIMHAEDGQVLQISRTWTDLTGYGPTDIPTFQAWLTRAYSDGEETVRTHMHGLFQGTQRSVGMEFPIRTRTGEERYWSFSASSPGTLQDGRRFIVSMAVDITERRQAEEALRASEERFRLLVDNVQEYALFQTDLKGTITSWNPGAERLFGHPTAEMLGQLATLLFTPEDQQAGVLEKELGQARVGRRSQDTRWVVRKDGERFWAQWITEPVRDESGRLRGVAKVLRDETDRQQADQATRASLAEKEELLKEVHHRVKNNLQVIVSLLNLQAMQMEEQRFLALLEETRNRVQAISSIHEQIYRSESFASIHLANYAHQLAPDLVRFYGLEQRIRVDITGDGATLELERAVPYGMLLNELVSNACKHAFPALQTGTITISIQPRGDFIELTVSDSGQGLPAGFDYRRTSSLGLKLVHGLVRQLRGTLQIQSEAGTTVQVRFPAMGKEVEE